LSLTGAAAHMSLHLNQQCQRAALHLPRFTGAPDYPVDEAQTSHARRRCLVGEKPYMTEFLDRQQLFRKLFEEAFGKVRGSTGWPLPSP
jgi:hypothetical protein